MEKVKPENAFVYRCKKCNRPNILDDFELTASHITYVCPECSYTFELIKPVNTTVETST